MLCAIRQGVRSLSVAHQSRGDKKMNRRVVTIDIETLPAEKAAECPSTANLNLIEPKENPAYLKTALSGDYGRILCIGYSDERLDGTRKMGFFGWDKESESLHADERRTLQQFWEMMRGFNPQRDRLVGHNIFDFDLRFIIKRSIINRIRRTVDLSFARYRRQPVFDTMCEWDCWNLSSKISLEKLAQALSLPTSKTDEVNGSRVYELYQEGKHREIRDYCLKDVRLTRQIYKLMTFTTEEDLAENSLSAVTTELSLAQ
jgi:hypothetical protein